MALQHRQPDAAQQQRQAREVASNANRLALSTPVMRVRLSFFADLL
ncbi:MAG TPA: hypothetical protein VKC66_11795 [Xanthobacteraceae bacterium]|nr:hypothetical protein [Xanthobacteraceae bacterium]